MEYEPMFPEIFKEGCTGGFCTPPESMMQEIVMLYEKEVGDMLVEQAIENRLTKITAAFIEKIIPAINSKAGKMVVSSDDLRRVLGDAMEVPFLDVKYNSVNHALRKIQHEEQRQREIAKGV
jgi:hypothetical protein